MRTRVGAVLFALLAALLVAACGGGGGGGGGNKVSGGGGSVPAGADYVPSTAKGFFFVSTDTGGGQWKNADDLLKNFSGRKQLIAMIEQSLAKQKLDYETDIKPALGPETDAGILSFQGSTGNAVIAAQPQDESKFKALLNKVASDEPSTAITRKVGDWTLASDTQAALDAAVSAHNGTSLADNAAFKEAMGDLPGDALAKLWLDGAALTGLAKPRTGGTGTLPGFGKLLSLVAAVQAQSDGLSIRSAVKTSQALPLENYSAHLLDQVPSGALAYLSVSGLDRTIEALATIPAVKTQLASIEQQLGVSLQQLASLFAGEGALYVRQGVPLPEVTLVLKQADEAAARTLADKIFARLAPALGGQIVATTVSGVPVKQVRGQQFSLYYAVFDGELVVTDSTTGISGLKDTGSKLSDDSLFKDAKSAAGMPDSNAGFFYVNLKDTIPIIENLVTSSGRNIPPAVQQNLEPLRTALFYATIDGAKAIGSGFIGIQ
jgi:hypothetical protein